MPPHLSFKVCVLELTWPLACCVIKGRSFNLSGPVFSALKWTEIPWRSLPSHRRRQHREHHFLSLNPEAVDSVKFLEVAYLNRSKKDQPAPGAERAWGMGAWMGFPTSACDPWLLLMRMEDKSKQFQARWDSGTSQLIPGKAEDNSIAPHRGFSRSVCKTHWGEAGCCTWVSKLLNIKYYGFISTTWKGKNKSHPGRKTGPPWVVKPVSWPPEMSQGSSSEQPLSHGTISREKQKLADLCGSDPACACMFQGPTTALPMPEGMMKTARNTEN